MKKGIFACVCILQNFVQLKIHLLDSTSMANCFRPLIGGKFEEVL